MPASSSAPKSRARIFRRSSSRPRRSWQSPRPELAKAQAEYDRQHSLPKQATTQQDIDAATAALKQAQAQVDAGPGAGDAELAGAAAHRRRPTPQVGQLKGQVEQAQAKLDQANLNLVLDAGHGAAGRLDHQAQCRARQLRHRPASRSSRSSRRRSGSRPISRRPSSTACARASRSRSRSTPIRSSSCSGHVDSIQLGSGSKFTAFPPENATGNFVKIVQRVPVKIVIDSGLDPELPLPLGISVEPTVTVQMSAAADSAADGCRLEAAL